MRCCFQLYAHSGFGSVYGNTVDAGGVTATDEETVDAVSVRVPLPQVQRFVVRAAEKRLHRLAVVCSRTRKSDRIRDNNTALLLCQRTHANGQH